MDGEGLEGKVVVKAEAMLGWRSMMGSWEEMAVSGDGQMISKWEKRKNRAHDEACLSPRRK